MHQRRENKSKDETNEKNDRQRRQDPVRHAPQTYRNTGVVEDLDLSKVQLLNGRQVKWIKCILEGNALAENIKGVFLENLKPAVRKAVSKASSSSKDSSEDNINEDESDSSEYVYHESEYESTDDQEEFPGQEEVMTEEQAAQMQKYLDSFSCSC